ncbi:MAG: hypothetical protein KC486_18535, partial [Myxococcales bacterium]|nr:hypothetical protein [Myxococcales bacterium]
FDYYQYWVSCDDRDVGKLLRMYTDLPLEEIDALTKVEGAAINNAKSRLAYEATRLLHGQEEADKATKASRQAFGGGGDWSAVPCVAIAEQELRLVDLVTHPDIAAFKSKREARQRIEGGAVKIDGEVVSDPKATLSGSEELRLQAGKKIRLRVILGSASC